MSFLKEVLKEAGAEDLRVQYLKQQQADIDKHTETERDHQAKGWSRGGQDAFDNLATKRGGFQSEIDDIIAKKSDVFSSDKVKDAPARNTILWAAEKWLQGRERDSDEGWEYERDVKVKAGPRGGIVLDCRNCESRDSFSFGRGRARGWNNWETHRPPQFIFLFPKGDKLCMYAPETQQKYCLGKLSDTVKLIKAFNVLDPKYVQQIDGDDSSEGSNPYD